MDAVVIGGVVLDVVYQAARPAVRAEAMAATSTPVRLARRAAGGVGRNIALALSRLGASVTFVSVVGDDATGDHLLAEGLCFGGAGAQSSVVAVTRVRGASSATYTALLDGGGELAAAAADMDVFERLTPELCLRPEVRSAIAAAKFVVVDGNVPAATLEAVAACVAATRAARPEGGRAWPRLAVDPISREKARRCVASLPRIDVLKPNHHEAAVIAALLRARPAAATAEAAPPVNPKAAAAALRDAGVGVVLCTCGPRGCEVATAAGDAFAWPAPRVERVVKVTGAGDSFLAGYLVGAMRGLPLRAALEIANAAAAASLSAAEVVGKL